MVKWFVEEKDSGQARALLDLFLDEEARFVVPELAYAEVASAFRFHRGLSSREAERYVEILLGYEFDSALLTSPLLRSALRTAHSLGTTVYDALYLALATEVAGVMVTADASFERKARGRHVATVAKAYEEFAR